MFKADCPVLYIPELWQHQLYLGASCWCQDGLAEFGKSYCL